MSEPLAERLKQFTPDGSGLDRDGLLFAAGRASARPNRRWVALSTLLAVSQVATLLLLWPRAVPYTAPTPVVPQREHPVAPPGSGSPSGLLALNRLLEGPGLNLPAPMTLDSVAPSDPPLRAMSTPPTLLE
jgi:hypothetical protein